MKNKDELSHGFYGIFLCFCLLFATITAQTETKPLEETNIRINAPLATIIVILIGVFFVMGVVSVYVRQCAERRFAEDDFIDEAGSRRLTRGGGLDPVVIGSFPMFLYSDVKDLKIGKSALECAVCLNEFEDDETLRLIPECYHVFHPECIDVWLVSHVTCPVCRANLLPKPGDLERNRGTVFGNYRNSGSPENPVHNVVNEPVFDINIASPEVINIAQTPVHNRPPRANSKRQKITGKFPRSHSTGHSLVQPGEDCERFTLRLPEEVRNKLMISGLSRAQSNSSFPRERSMKNGYRSSSVGTGSARINHGYYERFDGGDRVDRWGFTTVPPFFSRGGSTRSSKDSNGGPCDEITVAPKNLLKSVKLPFDRIFEKESTGERSFDRLRTGGPS